ncbi:SCO3374 family protein [Streptomyces sp. NPDC006638]|uniref:SCO3374 family protein n=1 Tax=unclassified Streptomyces TaxID=2593676 RepID=UPI0033A16236
MTATVPLPRRAPLQGGRARRASAWARWYGDGPGGLGWPTDGGSPLALLTGTRFDVLELPAGAGAALLRRIGPTGPVALGDGRMRLLVAAGSADELPGLLDWLEWGAIGSLTLGLTALGAGDRTPAPVPPWWPAEGVAQGAAVWLRPPEPGREVEATLPALAPFGRAPGNGGSGDAPDLVRLVDAAATECHRARLLHRITLRTNAQPLAFS